METVIRVFLFYVLILLGLRVMGKREFSQLSPLELVTLLLIPELVQQSVVRDDMSVVNGIIGLATLFAIVFISSLLEHHSKTFQKMVGGSPTVLVAHGEFVPDVMNRERVSPDEIYTEMHKAGLAELSEVKWAIMESDGQIAIVPGAGEKTVSPMKAKGAKKNFG
jgi:uncharacterized membrane protein YcaP (DUF421 family)